jgi:hypothetical protein
MKLFKEHLTEQVIEEAISYHIANTIPLDECMFRYGSQKYFEYFQELRKLFQNDNLHESLLSIEIIDILESDLGEFAEFEGREVPLDFIMEEETEELNKPKRGGPKKFYVYVRDPQTKNIKKITFGDTTGLSVKYGNPERKKSFAARHQCSQQKDKTTAAYWACRSNRYFGNTPAERAGYW